MDFATPLPEKKPALTIDGRPMRFLTAIGPGNIIGSYRDWKRGAGTASETAVTFSSLEFDFFKKHAIPFWAIGWSAEAQLLVDGENRIEHRPRLTSRSVSGLAYHAMYFLYAISLLGSAIRFRASHVIVDSGTTHWFCLSLFRCFGIEVVPLLHSTFWPIGHPPKKRSHRWIQALDKAFFKYCVKSALGVSPECGRQVAVMSSDKTRYFDFRAQFRLPEFKSIPLQSPPVERVNILYAGRIVRDKGVFDLPLIAEQLNAGNTKNFVVEVCGTGADFQELHAEVTERNLTASVLLHGKLDRADLLRAYARAHVVIVPSRSDCSEGLNMVCIEAALAGRPVIASPVVPALEFIPDGSIEAKVDDPDDFADKILGLVSDAGRYRRLATRSTRIQAEFTDGVLALDAILDRWLSAHRSIPRVELAASGGAGPSQ